MKPFLFLFLINIYSISYSQSLSLSKDAIAKNFIFFEIGKTGLIYNMGYDHQLAGKKAGFRAAEGFNFGEYKSLFNIGGGIYQLFGKTKKYLELGMDIYYLSVNEVSDDQKGISLIYPDYSVKTFYASLNIGFRNISKKGLFRIGLAPGITKDEFIPGGYIGFGLRL